MEDVVFFRELDVFFLVFDFFILFGLKMWFRKYMVIGYGRV